MVLFAFILLLFILPWSAIAEIRYRECGLAGKRVEAQDVPWQAVLHYGSYDICNGVIINIKYILTAPDCVADKKTSNLWVYVGYTGSYTGSRARVCKVIIHPESSKTKQDSNLALLKLCEPLLPSEDIKEIAIIDKQPQNGAQAYVSGRGSYNKLFGRCGKYVIRRKEVQLYDVKTCAAERKNSAPNISVTDLNICTAKKERICSFDKGAPLVIDGKLAGLMAYGDCSTEPDVYFNLVHHKDWLQANTKEQ
ncbi:trypsin-3-like [Drosophila takahashii]|uniref:trypsin-3-like n=1 Tax=Drosophila takahashii TaxID=29030 RepID=UPI001CF884C8|nr:trypsin-3-like [Drosophila takahashii]